LLLNGKKSKLGLERISKFQITVKGVLRELEGTLTIVPNNKSVCVNLKEQIPYELRLPILKEIFYQFCMPEARIFTRQDFLEGVENFKFIDNHVMNKKAKTIFEELLSYDLQSFNPNKRKERIIAYVKNCIDIIDKECKRKDELFFQNFKWMGRFQKYKCYLLVQSYLDKKYGNWKSGRHRKDIFSIRLYARKKYKDEKSID